MLLIRMYIIIYFVVIVYEFIYGEVLGIYVCINSMLSILI